MKVSPIQLSFEKRNLSYSFHDKSEALEEAQIILGESEKFLLNQRLSMPVPHRQFIKWISEFTPLKQMKQLDEYRKAVEAVKNFRSGHIRTVSQTL